MTDHRDHLNHDQHDYDLDPVNLDQVDLSELRDARDAATYAGDLVCALRVDNALEDRGELAEVSAGRRRTCRACRGWADHVHDPFIGETMKIGGRWHPTFTRADVAATADIAARVFALAETAPPDLWQELADGSHRVTVALDSTRFDIRMPADTDGQPSPAYIEDYRPGLAGGLPVPLPVVYANARATTAIAEARQYVTARTA